MMVDLEKLAAAAIAYDAGDARRVQHLMKVYAFCRLIGRSEGLDARQQNVLEAAALLHDIGIHQAESKHGSPAGVWQEKEGPAVAAPMLRQAGADEQELARVCWLIAHHHTYGAGEDTDLRILFEADFLVNAYEQNLPEQTCRTACERIFRTETGRRFLRDMFLEKTYRPVAGDEK